MEDRNLSIPTGKKEEVVEEPVGAKDDKEITKEEASYIEKVFFEEDEKVMLRDGAVYKVPPLSLKDARVLLKKMNNIDPSIVVANLIQNDDGEDMYEELLDVLIMAFKSYYKDVTKEYLAEYVDTDTAKKILDIMIGLNGLKKNL